ncbi:GlxA family transcriptional regulator [Phytoactinopolyspora mesophila]|uniref:Helix-turn-helix domain-containing protein n=1 Tax=Phytoactinopolyspora mesophila TaxID=2650750 RepID=A0A7K3M940_9ACTN|nr:helix-turn-helix domain-containing protein [Phytoactinopolyspora mesophila]NDL59793.1 helix-turn-helix domain-containing protein [Phytoactinopolyspora mesophila]
MSQESSQGTLHRIGALVDEGSNPFEIACMTEVFGIHRPEAGGLLYDFQLCARQQRVPMRQDFFTMTELAGLRVLDQADTVIVPNRPDTSSPRHPEVLAAITRAHERGARLVGMCSGAFTLAEAGVLAGRRATVHWKWADEFRLRFPDVVLDENVLFIDDGDILTSAGSAAALDLALHIVRTDHGTDIATAVARRLVFAAHRPGGQRQFIERPIPRDTGSALSAALDWAERHATESIGVGDIARRAAMSPATLHRRFRAEIGRTPLEWLSALRLAHARRLLETTALSVEQIAHASGLGTSANLRTHLTAETGLSPTTYRRQFHSSGRASNSSVQEARV